MTIHVLIEYDSAGRLHGYVIERRKDGFVHKGDDLLKGSIFKQTDSAVQECDRKILEQFKLIEPPVIEYQMPGKAWGL